MAADSNRKSTENTEVEVMKPRMSGNWCVTWQRSAHVVRLGKGWYRIACYGEPKPDHMGMTSSEFLGALYATNRRAANEKAKLYVSGAYDTHFVQQRLF